jgi:hypothetical protein
MAIEYRKAGEEPKKENRVKREEAMEILSGSLATLAAFSGRREPMSVRVRPDVIQALKGMDGDYAKHVEQALIEYAQKAGVL